MRTHTSGFTEALKTNGRELDSKITYQTVDGYYTLTTENGYYINTESLQDLATEKGPVVYAGEYLNSITPIFNVNMFKTVMKCIEIDCNYEMPSKTWLNAQTGVKVSGSYEYVDLGNYFINDTPKYNADTKSYFQTAYDKMIESMIKYDDSPLGVTYPITLKNYIIAICNKFLWSYTLPTTFPNQDTEIISDLYIGLGLTYRDVLDDICPATMGNFLFDINDIFTIKYPTETSEVIDDESLKDINVTFGRKYGPVNSLVLSRAEDSDNIYSQNLSSISENGLTEYKIKDNILLSSGIRDNFIDEMFTQLDGLEYCLYDISTVGLYIFEPLDRFAINHNEVDYSVLMLNDEIDIAQGLTEQCYVEEPEETTTDYTTSAPTDKSIKNAVILTNKNAGQIILKVNSDGKIVQAELNADAENGSEFNVKADNINFESYTFDLATEGINITSDNVDITNNGIKLKNGAELIGADGILTLFQFKGRVVKTDMVSIDYGLLGFEGIIDGETVTGYIKTAIVFDVYVPDNFTIKEAKITINHFPLEVKNFSGVVVGWGYARKIKAYKTIDVTNIYRSYAPMSEYTDVETESYSEISGVLGVNGYTPSSPSAENHILENYISEDLKESISSGSNRLRIESSDTPILTGTDENKLDTLAVMSGMVFATLNVIGYYKYE